MGSLSNWAESQVLEYFFKTSAPTRPAALAIALCTDADPVSDASTGVFSTSAGVEVSNSGTGYTRVAIAPLDANWTHTSGQVVNTSAITFPTALASWGTVRYAAIVTSATYDSGNVLAWCQLAADKTISTSDVAVFAPGALVFTID